MSHVPHELPEEFPEYIEKMHTLKMEDRHFSRLAEEYHRVNREVHRMETRVDEFGVRVVEESGGHEHSRRDTVLT